VAVADALPNIPSVVADDAAGARMLAHHLQERGHRSVIYVMSPARPVSALRRRDAFFERAGSLSMEVEEYCLDNESKAEKKFIENLLARPSSRRPTALASWSDTTAFYLCASCRSVGLRVPEDLAIVGFDGCPMPVEPLWSLTTVRAPWAEIARTAVHYLDLILKGKSVPPETVLPVEFLPGQTT
jgi:DNA-binding LacI/PurR family transcriptional regulator